MNIDEYRDLGPRTQFFFSVFFFEYCTILSERFGCAFIFNKDQLPQHRNVYTLQIHDAMQTLIMASIDFMDLCTWWVRHTLLYSVLIQRDLLSSKLSIPYDQLKADLQLNLHRHHSHENNIFKKIIQKLIPNTIGNNKIHKNMHEISFECLGIFSAQKLNIFYAFYTRNNYQYIYIRDSFLLRRSAWP